MLTPSWLCTGKRRIPNIFTEPAWWESLKETGWCWAFIIHTEQLPSKSSDERQDQLLWPKDLHLFTRRCCVPVTSASNDFAAVRHWCVSVCLQFADWCMNYGKHGCRTPDTPFSLFEGKKCQILKYPGFLLWCQSSQRWNIYSIWLAFVGMAGTIYFLADLLQPAKARFPAFEVWILPLLTLPWVRCVALLPVALTDASLLLDVTVFLSLLYYYITKLHESQRWEFFCLFYLICCSVL